MLIKILSFLFYKNETKTLSFKERKFIEGKLKENYNFTIIGKELNKHHNKKPKISLQL